MSEDSAAPAVAEITLFIRDEDGQSAALRQVVKEGTPSDATFDPVTVHGWHIEVHPPKAV